MKRWKRRILFVIAAGFTMLAVALFIAISYYLSPVHVPDLDPKKILKRDLPEPSSHTSNALIDDKENLALLVLAPKETEGQPGGKDYLEALLKIKEREKRDNALIYYAVAAWLSPEIPTNRQRELINEILEKGWRSPESDELLPYLESWQRALDKIRQGAALDHAEGIGITKDYNTPILPNYAAKMLCVEGRYLESQDRYAEALDDYLTALTMGRDYTSPGNFLISHLLGCAFDAIALRQIDRLARNGILNEDDNLRALQHVDHIEASFGDTVDAVSLEMASTLHAIHRTLEDPAEMTKYIEKTLGPTSSPELVTLWNALFSGDQNIRNRFFSKVYLRFIITRNTERIGPDAEALYDLQTQVLEEPWYKDPTALNKRFEKQIEQSHPLMRIMMWNPMEAKVRRLRVISSLRQTQLALAVSVWKNRHGEYPDNLDCLFPDPIKACLPIDPFSGMSFHYRSDPIIDSFDLWSVGPDTLNENLTILYDSTNGSVSQGDLVVNPVLR